MRAALQVSQVGIGLRQPHCAQLLAALPPLGFVEVHSENFFADGGAAIAMLREARSHYAVSLHGVGLALGSACGLDPWHLERLERLVDRIAPVRVSDHACFARTPQRARVARSAADTATVAATVAARDAATVHANDLLPIAFTDAALAIIAANVERVQARLKRQLLVENLSSYVSFNDDTMSETEFFAALCRRTGCAMLLDVNNLMVNALNAPQATPQTALAACLSYVDQVPLGSVGEIHLAGYCETGSMFIDDHGSRVRPAVWAVYEHALRRFGTLPTLVEWDTDLPTLDVLLGEADHAARVVARVAASAGV